MKVGILGASGLVGRTMLEVLAVRSWVDEDPLLLVSGRSAGTKLSFRGRELVCVETDAQSLAGLDVLLCSAGREAAGQWAPVAAGAGALVVDNSSRFRLDEGVPLVVPEVNPPAAGRCGPGKGTLIANPNCSTIQIAVFAGALARAFGLRELHAVTLQAVSGAGQNALAQWEKEKRDPDAAGGGVFPRRIAGNVLPAIGPALPAGDFEEEAKVRRELRRILPGCRDLPVTCTAVRVPVHTGHSVAVRCVLEGPVDMSRVRGVLDGQAGLVLASDPHAYATPLEVAGTPLVHVGRLRAGPDQPRALLAWVVADNLLKGAAWNAVQIVERCLGLGGPDGNGAGAT